MRKRYVTEMANDFEKKYPGEASEIVKIRNAYLSWVLTEEEAVKALLDAIKSAEQAV